VEEAGVLATFVIGLREGLEAALIVGIVAGFLRRNGDRAALRPMWAGVALAVLICVVVAVVLQVISADLPQQEQEGLETVIGLVAVGMITYMIVWMRGHARSMRRELEAAAGNALARGSTWALVAMAFLAVLREGFETTVFLLAAFQSATSPVTAGGGAALGILVAIALGYGIYRGAVHIDLARFFTVTAVFLVLVAAGLFVSAVHTAHEATWLNVGQTQVADLSGIVQPGTPISSLLTGVLGIQPQPTVVEVVAWLVYLVPMLVFVLWPVRRPARSDSTAPAGASA
jgi:high-affinity iron transporter